VFDDQFACVLVDFFYFAVNERQVRFRTGKFGCASGRVVMRGVGNGGAVRCEQ